MVSTLSLISYAITRVPKVSSSLSLPRHPETKVIIMIEVIRIAVILLLPIPIPLLTIVLRVDTSNLM